MKKIGEGTFTKAFLNNEGRVILKTDDKAKECMALGWFPESKLFPTVEYKELGVYEMEYLGPTPKSVKRDLRPRQYRLYKALQKLFDGGYGTFGIDKRDYFFEWHKKFDSLPSEFRKEKETLKLALDALGNYGTDIAFEISPRNIRIKNGFLILMDCFFFADDLSKRFGF